ncbi:UDP-N-acetylglucosamine transferase subunit ALG13 homolog [Mytilus californianus]|uniref:UDP-N-acetylglucosamine transferase subunit ALG13 homolog n=1 Tax=Mytilus californianus TaxID=6549 RepID=UPI00224535A0|nr:UDP-N-acetylglucosamine transferase subunit ALG13 homolog [Mytilus californianus]
MSKTVFVTVGTTEFNSLIQSITQDSIYKILKSKGYNKLLIQIGRCAFDPSTECSVRGFTIEYYRYKPSIADDIANASLVISHAGAGSCLESLTANKPLLVVVNNELMDNHQLELARQLKKDGNIEYCDCSSLEETLKTCDFSKLKPYTPGKPQLFADFLDNLIGYTKQS